MKVTIKKYWFSFTCVFLITACGGGNSDNANTVDTVSSQTSEATFEPGVFLASSEFEAQCEAPRTGFDTFNNSNFPDIQGSSFLEKLWLRSWTFESYLWFDEVADNDPNNFTVPDYFAQLRTEQLTDSGRPRDNFHFSQNTAEYNELTQSGVSRGYGFNWQRNSAVAPREFIVRYTEPGSSAALAGVPRGATLLTVDGVDFIFATSSDDIDTINDGLFPEEAGNRHVFTLELINGDIISVALESEEVNVVPVQNVAIIDSPAGQVGYMQFNAFNVTSQNALIEAFSTFQQQGIDELVIDLRYNGGGRLALSSQIAYMVAGESQTQGEVFEELLTNGKFDQGSALPFYDSEIDYDEGVFVDNLLPSPELSRVFILSTGNTCSASESLINGLRGINVDVVLIGDTTCGKPFGFFPTDNCGETYFTIQFQSINAQGFGEYQDGFIPVDVPLFEDQIAGCRVPDDFSQPLGSESEALFSTALNYMQIGVQACPEELAQSQINIDGNNASANRYMTQTQRRDVILNAIIHENREPIQ